MYNFGLICNLFRLGNLGWMVFYFIEGAFKKRKGFSREKEDSPTKCSIKGLSDYNGS